MTDQNPFPPVKTSWRRPWVMPRYSLNLIFTLYFCSISPRLALRWWQQHDKNTSGLLLHIYGLYTVRTMLGLVKSTHRRQRSLASSRVYKRTSPFANCLKSEPVCKRTEPRHAVCKRTKFSYGLQHRHCIKCTKTHMRSTGCN